MGPDTTIFEACRVHPISGKFGQGKKVDNQVFHASSQRQKIAATSCNFRAYITQKIRPDGELTVLSKKP